jgi:glycosyltransferase 2 family protein
LASSVDSGPASAPPSSNRRALVQRSVEVGISLAFLFLALRGINTAVLWRALKSANYWWLGLSVFATLAILVLKAWRWQLLFLPEYRVPYRPVLTAMCGGYLASNVLPARMGELVRVVLLVSDQPISTARAVSTIVVERLLDILSLLIIMVATLPFVHLPEAMLRAAQMLGVVALLGSLTLIILSFWKERLLSVAHVVFGRIHLLDRPGVYAALGHLIDGFATLRTRLGLLLIGLSFVCWLGVIAMAWSAARAIGLEAPLTAMVLSVVVTTLGMLVPSSPGYIGVFHYLVTVALAPFGISKEIALSFAIVWHGVNYLTLSVSGVLALWLYGTSLGQVLQRWRARGVSLA